MASKPVSTTPPARTAHNARPAKSVTPLHGGVSHNYGVAEATKIVSKIHKAGC